MILCKNVIYFAKIAAKIIILYIFCLHSKKCMIYWKEQEDRAVPPKTTRKDKDS